MEYLDHKSLLEGGNRHYISEPHIRVNVSTIPQSVWEDSQKLFDHHHGEVLLIILSGNGVVNTQTKTIEVNEGDQILINDGEAFNVLPDRNIESIRVQFVWTPGLNPCKTCWERDSKFYNKNR